MATLSALYIVRNEEQLIRKSLDSVAPYVNSVVVIDSKSVDNTTYLCRQYKNLSIYQHDWVHDFSKSRNFGIKRCNTDWILVVDADEMIDKKSMSAIRSAIDSAAPSVMGFSIHVSDHESEWDMSDSTANPKSYFPSPQIRVFRRTPQIHYEGRVNESVRKSIEKAGGTIDVLDAKLHHFLWRGKGAEYATMKRNYYGSLVPGGAQLPSPAPEPQPPDAETRSMTPPPTSEPEVSIVMLGHNCLEHTQRAMESIQRYTPIPYNMFFVDNGSTDGTASYIKAAPTVRMITFKTNQGVPKGKNVGVKEALSNPSVKYVCVVDNDIIATPGWLEQMLAIINNQSTGVVGPMTSFSSGAQLLPSQHPSHNDAAAEAARMEPPASAVENVQGFCMLVKAEVFRKIGLFDESFGAYGNEDHDFCIRARKAGYDVLVANKAYVGHVGRATMKGVGRNMNWHSIMRTSSVRFKLKWNTPPAATTPVRGAVAATPAAVRNMIPQVSRTEARPKVSLVILTCNRIDVTRECLESVAKSSWNYELIIVDNGSTDGTQDYVSKSFPGAMLIRNEKNLGIPKGRNQGIRAASSDYIVLMDNDVVVRDGWLDVLMKPLRTGYDISGIEAWQIGGDFAASHKCVNPNERFDYLGGACCMFRRRVFQEAGLLDEGFSPAYYEDPDICVRAKAAGMKLAWVPTPLIKHKEHATLVFGQKDFNYQEALGRSYQRFASKMKGEIVVEHEKLNKPKKLRILYLGMQWDYGHRERGASFEHDNFFPSIQQWEQTAAMRHFDFVDLGKAHGVPKMSDMLMEAVQQFCPDAVFAVFFDPNHDPKHDVMSRISKTTPAKTIGWFCDSHWRYDSFDRPWAQHLDFNVTTSASAYDRYIRDGLASKVIKSQWAAAPGYRRIDGVGKDIEVSFVGQPHGDRRMVIDQLRRSGIHVEVYGTGWGRRLTFDEMISMFNRSKINLNLNNASDARFKQIKGRNFEVPGCGGLLLTGNAENLSDYYVPDKEIVLFESTQELADKIKYLLAHDAERQAIAEQGYQRTIHEHTYAQRFDYIFSKAGLL